LRNKAYISKSRAQIQQEFGEIIPASGHRLSRPPSHGSAEKSAHSRRERHGECAPKRDAQSGLHHWGAASMGAESAQ
jgi:hypothetical protein